MTAVRVVHVPGRTPYARKLADDRVQVLNESTVEGRGIPRDVTLSWLLAQRPWDWFDVIHLHHPDFEPIATLRAVLVEARRSSRRAVFTAHDTQPIFGDRATHHARLRLLADYDVPFVCLTARSEAEVRTRFGVRTAVAPHGYVAAPGTVVRTHSGESATTRFLIYGSLRANRDVATVLHCWRFASGLRATKVHLLLRAPSRASLAQDDAAWRAILDHAADPRLRVDVRPFPTDAEVDEAVAGADCLLLPYRSASHSGQLEHAFDLGALPVGARTGFLPDQVAQHGGLVSDPVWFDWSDGARFDYGVRLLEAMQQAHSAIQGGWRPHDADKFAQHRRTEHEHVMAVYREIYGVAR